MKEKLWKRMYLKGVSVFFACLIVMVAVCSTSAIWASAQEVATDNGAVSKTVSVVTDRISGSCTYEVAGLENIPQKEMTLVVTYTNSKGEVVTALEKQISLEGITDGKYQGTFGLTDLNTYTFSTYTVSVRIGEETITAADTVDFLVHTDKYKLSAKGKESTEERIFTLASTESETDVIVPGANNMVKLVIWKKGADLTTAKTAGGVSAITNKSKNWSVTVSDFCEDYGIYYARVVLSNEAMQGTKSLGTITFQTGASLSKVTAKKSKALEKKKAFQINATGVGSAFGLKKVYFDLYNEKGKKVLTKKAVNQENTTTYTAQIGLKALDYQMLVYTAKVRVVDKKNISTTLEKTVEIDEKPGEGALSVVKKENATCKYVLTGAYLPGGIKNLRFSIYQEKDGKKTFVKRLVGVYNKKKDNFTADMELDSTGKYIVYAYGTTKWGKKICLNQYEYRIKKGDLGKNGWYYEKYAGKLYKFFYRNNKKVTDLTDVLKIKGAQNFYIEVNRAACCVTIYAYDSAKKDYIIPVRTCTVSVGSDTRSTGSASALNTKTYFTPLGTYSVCSNGTAVRYTVKQMYEPDGKILYARWTTHIVGNVYFHAIAVGSDSHYALPSSTYNRLGSPASAGCIRMTVLDAKWIYDHVATGSKVVIKQGNSAKPGPLGKNPTITTNGVSYDPTDPEVPDSTKKKDYKAGKISGYITKSGKKVGNIAEE